MKRYAGIAAFSAIATFYCTGAAQSEAQELKNCDVTAKVVGLAGSGAELNVRSGPGPENRVIDKILQDDVVIACDYPSSWTEILYANDKTGWVSGKFLAPVDESGMLATREVATANVGRSFRHGEATQSSQYGGSATWRAGRVGSLYYRYFDDGSAAISEGPGILDGSLWSVRCKSDAMTDERSCTASDEGGSLLFILNNHTTSVCALKHDFPDRTAMIRIDREPAMPIEAGPCTADTAVLEKVKAADSVTVRAYNWPRDFSVDNVVSTTGLNEALELATYLMKQT